MLIAVISSLTGLRGLVDIPYETLQLLGTVDLCFIEFGRILVIFELDIN